MISRFKRALVIRFARLVRSAEACLNAAEIACLMRALQSHGFGVSIHPTVTIAPPHGLAVGNNVSIGDGCFINAEGGVQIRDNAQLSHHVTIGDFSHDFLDCHGMPICNRRRSWQQTVIGRNVRIGANARILPGVRIGDGAIVPPGAVVRRDVAPGEIVQQARQRNVSPTDMRSSKSLEAPIWLNGRARHPDIVFVASSGRSGSMTIARWLNGHVRIRGRHESRLQLVQWSTEYAEGTASRDETLSRLEDLFLDGTVYHPELIHVESDQKVYNLLPLLAEILPQARFIWLVRSGYDVVSSLVGRGWYSQAPDSFQEHNVAWWWKNWRVEGDRTDPMVKDWSDMPQFEKCAWYWAHANATIESAIEELRVEQVLRIRLEDIESDADRIARFCGVRPFGKKMPIANHAAHEKYDQAKWSEREKKAFERWCGPLMTRLYPTSAA